VEDVIVVVSRWYGGIQLGADRWASSGPLCLCLTVPFVGLTVLVVTHARFRCSFPSSPPPSVLVPHACGLLWPSWSCCCFEAHGGLCDVCVYNGVSGMVGRFKHINNTARNLLDATGFIKAPGKKGKA
jgi:hypothetical protein